MAWFSKLFKKKEENTEENIGSELESSEALVSETSESDNTESKDSDNEPSEALDSEALNSDTESTDADVTEAIIKESESPEQEPVASSETEVSDSGSGSEVSRSEDTEAEKEEEKAEEEKPAKKPGFFARLKQGLKKSRDNFVYNLDIVFNGAEEIDDDFYDSLEEIMIMGDIGVETSTMILDNLKKHVKEQKIVKPPECRELLIEDIKAAMALPEDAYKLETDKSIVFVTGVNGVGKTTSIGKLAASFKAEGKSVMLAAADTFRAAAGEQLKIWSDRAGVPIIGGREGADPSSVLFDAVQAAKARGTDILLVDTAGRLNNKKNLMNELAKMNKVIDREYPEAHRENLIVLDATTGQNALRQAEDFNEVSSLTGIVLTKMDGTAKGGIAIAIQAKLHIPVKYIGVGEHIEDLQKFDPDSYVRALFDRSDDGEDEEIKEQE